MRKKLLGLFMIVATLTMTLGTTCFMADTTDNVTTAGSSTCTVSTEVGSTFTITVPKTITLTKITATGADKGKSTASFSITPQGDIASTKALNVLCATTMTLKDDDGEGLNTQDATIDQSLGSWHYDELDGDTSASCEILTDNILPAGVWKGTFSMTISLSDET